MLKTAVETLKMDIFKAFKDKDVMDAFSEALMSTFPEGGDDFKSVADDFGEIAAGYLAKALAKPISDAIYKFVLQADINIVPTKLISPQGPVTGVINPAEVKII